MRAIIVGAGIAGLSTALALRRVGIEVTLYERAPELTEVGAGISLWANAIRALDTIGAGDAVRAVSLSMERSEFRTQRGHKVVASFRGDEFEKRFGVSPFVAMVHRADLVGALAGGLPAGVAHFGHECVGVESRGQRAAVHFKNGHTDEADLVIGADGIRSAVRAALFGPSEPRYAGYTGWRGVCPCPTSVTPGYIAEWWGRGQRFGITTLPQGRVYWFATKNSPPGQRSADERVALQTAFADWADPVPELLATTPSERILHNDILDRPPDPSWVSGRIVLIGDAAHATTPNFGQGGCQAIEDAVVLARNLRASPEVEQNLAAFVRERYPRTTALTRESWRFGRVGQWEGRLSCWFRDQLMALVMPVMGARTFPKYASFDVGPL